MTLQQLEYVLAVYKYRHFVRAAESCGVTQSTLSSMIRKLEEELDCTIFDRNIHPVVPTLAGEAVIKQAEVVLYHARQLKEMTLDEHKKVSGTIRLGITPTIAPYLIAKLVHYIDHDGNVNMDVVETDSNNIIEKLQLAQLDMAIMSLPHNVDDLLEIPLYTEKLIAYVSPLDPLFDETRLTVEDLPWDRCWTLKEEISLSQQNDTLQKYITSGRRSKYQSGSTATLLSLVNENGGFTIIPEMQVQKVRAEHKPNLRFFTEPAPERTVSLWCRKDYVRDGMLNVIAEGVKSIVPLYMIDDHLAHYPIKL